MFYKVIDKSADDTIIVCSSIHTEPGRFRFERQLNDFNVNCIFLNCPANQWYLHGIPGLGDRPKDARAALSNLIRARFPGTRLFGFGSSMGASGIIMMTAGLPMQRVFAFCPEIDLFDDFSFSKQHYNGPSSAGANLWNELADCANVRIFYGEECEHDLYQLSKIRDITSIPTQTFSNQQHGVIEAIYFTEGMSGIINSMIQASPLRPKKIAPGHISGSLITCRSLWNAFLASRNRSHPKPDLAKLASLTQHDRSYYPLVLYWLSRLQEVTCEKKILLEEAHQLAPLSLRIASELFKMSPDPDRVSNFKERFKSHFGEKYAASSRASALHAM